MASMEPFGRPDTRRAAAFCAGLVVVVLFAVFAVFIVLDRVTSVEVISAIQALHYSAKQSASDLLRH